MFSQKKIPQLKKIYMTVGHNGNDTVQVTIKIKWSTKKTLKKIGLGKFVDHLTTLHIFSICKMCNKNTPLRWNDTSKTSLCHTTPNV